MRHLIYWSLERKEEKAKEAVTDDKLDDKNAQIRRLNNKVGLQKEIIKGALDKIRVSLQQDDLDNHTLQSLHDTLDKKSSEVQIVIVPLFDQIIALKANQWGKSTQFFVVMLRNFQANIIKFFLPF